MRNCLRSLALILVLGLGLAGTSTRADSLPDKLSPTCPNSGFWSGGFITNICWKCFFPIRIFALYVGGGPVPDDTAAPVCVCPGRTFGIPAVGITLGMWQPTHLIEVVRQPWCSPVWGGPIIENDLKLGVSGLARYGGYTTKTAGIKNPVNPSYYNFHWWAYPVNVILSSLTGSVCSGNKGYDMDLLYLTEIDPTWIDDELAFFTQPEAKIFAAPLAVLACAADSVSATVHKPLTSLFWCAGSWGHAYPFSGHATQQDSPPRETSLAAFRGLAAMHRRTIAKKTYGNGALCQDQIKPMIQKQQYRLQTFYPLPERSSNHWLGASTFRWGEWRNIPVKGEDYVYLQWTYTECCMTFW